MDTNDVSSPHYDVQVERQVPIPMADSTILRADIYRPIVHLGGWFDWFLDATLRCFQGIQTQGKTEQCRANQRLIIGPWIHGPDNIGARSVGELDFGPDAAFDFLAYRLKWYDYWLKDATDNGVMDGAPVVGRFMKPICESGPAVRGRDGGATGEE